ncbi:basic proline-rich protein-like [Artibeus jamaicensis]|uniref:basic proline-rich protein-like n=1 Tax=Artibeus jamaicensis TaxID=9417 RepID=UPI00235A52D3|nr:basic proline-rich protein-like [Artibeus jamaicensis]
METRRREGKWEGGGGEPRAGPGRAAGPRGGGPYLSGALDGRLAPSGARGPGASGGRRRPLPRPPLLFPLQSPPRRRRRRPRPARRAAPIPLSPALAPIARGPRANPAPGSRSAPPRAAPPAPPLRSARPRGPPRRSARLPAAAARARLARPALAYPRPPRRPPPAAPAPSRAAGSLAPSRPPRGQRRPHWVAAPGAGPTPGCGRAARRVRRLAASDTVSLPAIPSLQPRSQHPQQSSTSVFWAGSLAPH